MCKSLQKEHNKRKIKNNTCKQICPADHSSSMTDDEICSTLSISKATLKNWIRLKKISPDLDEKHFSRKYILNLLSDIHAGKTDRLKTRRNKTSITGKLLYKNYIHTPENKKIVAGLLAQGQLKNQEIPVLLANFAIQLFYQKNKIPFKDNAVLDDFFIKDSADDFSLLIRDLLFNTRPAPEKSPILRSMMSQRLQYIPGEDTLGFVYLSMKDIGRRKLTGTYYTPSGIVTELIGNLKLPCTDFPFTCCDPCCGTGNFLIALNEQYSENGILYGQDIDPTAVHIARINLFLANSDISASALRDHIRIGDSLTATFKRKFDVIIGNPPWGCKFSREQRSKYKRLYSSAAGKYVEAYDLFVERALSMLENSGILSFVLPEAILSVTSHHKIRHLILENCSFRYIAYLGNAFTDVQCPAIILALSMNNPGSVSGCRVSTDNHTFIITKNRALNANALTLNLSDEDYECVKFIDNIKNAVYLKGNAQFALGIVTGNNKEFIFSNPKAGTECILKGNAIRRYSIRTGRNYIHYTPELFQQAAPTEIYRAKEKLLYRFICDIPVFAYDDAQMLSLNSCNVLIPMIPGLSIKYVLAVLNSSVVAFWISKKFNSIKLLRSHIEQIPIPSVSANTQQDIENDVNAIMQSKTEIRALFQKLDKKIIQIYGLNETQQQCIDSFSKSRNMYI